MPQEARHLHQELVACAAALLASSEAQTHPPATRRHIYPMTHTHMCMYSCAHEDVLVHGG
jgi:hypothetical protein